MMMMSLDNSSIKTDSISSCESSSASDSEDFTGEVFFESQLSTIGNRLIGCAVMVRNKLNETYHGTLVTFTSDFDVILESCHQVTSASTTSSSNKKTTPLHSRIFERDQIVQVVACDIEDDFSLKCDTSSSSSSFNDSPVRQSNDIVGGMSKLTLSTSSSSSSSSGCSSSGGLLSTSSTSEDCGRELEPYVFDDGKEDDLFYSLTTDTTTTDKKVTESSQQQQQQQQTKSSNGWKVEDMLQVNKSRYGYKSTFNSEMTEYTLPLIKQNTAEFRRREAEAERLAREIESDLGYRANVDKELSDGEDEDEEMAFSAVHRTDKKTKTPNTERHRTPKTGSTQQQQRQRITSSATSSSSNRQRNPRRVK